MWNTDPDPIRTERPVWAALGLRGSTVGGGELCSGLLQAWTSEPLTLNVETLQMPHLLTSPAGCFSLVNGEKAVIGRLVKPCWTLVHLYRMFDLFVP